jgi:hypothetical protein
MRLNLGAGEHDLKGYRNLDIKNGEEVYPLPFADDSCDEVRASHVLEHFSHRQINAVLTDWVRVLKPGGVLKIAVPDFKKITAAYHQGQPLNVQGYLMGGHDDEHDFHRAIFDKEALTDALKGVGVRGISTWSDSDSDCSSYPISLNLKGTKGVADIGQINAVMSVPRLGFQDNLFCAIQALTPLRIGLRKTTGAFWGQCLERAIDQAIEEGAKWILTIDYDTVFKREHVEQLINVASQNPDVDALVPVQQSRSKQAPLMTYKGNGDQTQCQVDRGLLDGDVLDIHTGHFGLTLLKVDTLKKLSRPLFLGVPNQDMEWGEGRIDDDIFFWKKLEQEGYRACLANRVAVGHLELMVLWPDMNFNHIYQHPSKYWEDGEPEDVWE